MYKLGEYICLLKQETFKIIPSAVFGVSNILPSSALALPYKRTADLMVCLSCMLPTGDTSYFTSFLVSPVSANTLLLSTLMTYVFHSEHELSYSQPLFSCP